MSAPRRGGRPAVTSLIVAGGVLLAAVALASVAARGPAPPRTMEERVHEVAASLRCPVCQNLSVADSPSRLAQEMRATIERELRAGRSPDDIRADFAEAYGAWVLLSPPRRGLDVVAWIGPAALFAGGLVVVARAVRRWTAAGPDGPGAASSDRPPADLSASDRALLERAMAGPHGEAG